MCSGTRLRLYAGTTVSAAQGGSAALMPSWNGSILSLRLGTIWAQKKIWPVSLIKSVDSVVKGEQPDAQDWRTEVFWPVIDASAGR